MIEVKNLTKTFKTEKGNFKAIDNVSFSVKEGEIYGLIGLSGAGKSTLVRCLNLLEVPDDGEIWIDDVEITSLPEKELSNMRKEIGMIFQHFNLFQQKNVYENIAYALRLQGLDKTAIDDRVNELLRYISLEGKAKAYPSELSGGQKQRVAIARALATKPKVLLSDEGTSALDPETTKSILNLLKRAVEEMGLTIILITHQMEVAKEVCDRIAVMEDGKIIEENTVDQLFLAPKHRRTLSFIETLGFDVDTYQVESHDSDEDLYRLSFDDEVVKQPIISELSRKYNVNINLLAGNINALSDKQIGSLTVEILGEEDEKYEALKYLKDIGVHVEVI